MITYVHRLRFGRGIFEKKKTKVLKTVKKIITLAFPKSKTFPLKSLGRAN